MWFALNFGISLILLYPFFYTFLSKPEWYPKAFVLKRAWAKWILFITGIFVTVKNIEKLKKVNKPCIFCANHTSYLDIVLCYMLIPDYFTFMGKAELLKAPLFSIFFSSGMDIAVERKSRIGAHQAFLRAAAEIDKGHSMFMFPEGTISSDGVMKPFKNGAFKLAIDKQVEVVPITFKNNWKILQNGGFFKSNGRPGILDIVVHEPISTKGTNELFLPHLKEQVYNVIAESLK